MINNVQQVMRPIREYGPYYHGYYTVSNRKFETQHEAVCEHIRSEGTIRWSYHDDVFSALKPGENIELSLPELYAARAKQLRENYDYVLVRFSGGVDSTQALHAFLDNNIFIDEIQMGTSKRYERHMNSKDTSQTNILSEIKYSAEARLKKYKHLIDPRTFVNYYDIHDKCQELLNENYWWEGFSPTAIPSIHWLSRGTAPIDGRVREVLDQGKRVAIVVGVDKPLVRYHNGEFYGFFSNTGISHAQFNHQPSSIAHATKVITEPFFWTPDMPEIVWKQWQEIKRYALLNKPLLEACKRMEGIHAQDLRNLLNTIVYQSHTWPYWESAKRGTKNAPKRGDDPRLPWHSRPLDMPVWENLSDAARKNYEDGLLSFGNTTGSNILDIHERSGLYSNINIGYYQI